MSWIDAIKNVVTKKTRWARMLNGYTPIFSQFGTDIYASDVVQQAVKCIVSEMSKLTPSHDRDNGEDILPVNDDRQRILSNPNPLMTRSAFIEKVTWQLLLKYNAFIIPVYDVWYDKDGIEKRNYRALYPVSPTTVTFEEDTEGILYVKMEFPNNYMTTLPYSDIIHLRYNYSANEFMGGNEQGQPDHAALLKTLGINECLLQGIDKAVRGSFSINGIAKYSTMLDKGKTDAAIKEFEEKVKNSDSGILPLDIKTEYIPIKKDVKLVDSDTLKFLDSKILRNWGVSLSILTGDYTKAQYEAFYQKTLEPLITMFSDEFTRVLFTEREISFGNKIRFYPKNLIFMSMDQTLEMVRLLGDSGSLFENEKRVAFGLRPLSELAGIRMQSLNYVNVSYAQEYQTENKGQTSDNNGGVKNEEGTKTIDETDTGTEEL